MCRTCPCTESPRYEVVVDVRRSIVSVHERESTRDEADLVEVQEVVARSGRGGICRFDPNSKSPRKRSHLLPDGQVAFSDREETVIV